MEVKFVTKAEGGVFDRFTDRSRSVLGLARNEAVMRKHDLIGTEHILLGILDEGKGVAAQVLRNFEIDFEKLRKLIDESLGSTPTANTGDAVLPFTHGAKLVLEAAYEAAREFHHNYIGTEHLIIGILRESPPGSPLCAVFTQCGLVITDVIDEVKELLGVNGAPADGESKTVTAPKTFNVQFTAHQTERLKSLAVLAANALKLEEPTKGQVVREALKCFDYLLHKKAEGFEIIVRRGDTAHSLEFDFK